MTIRIGLVGMSMGFNRIVKTGGQILSKGIISQKESAILNESKRFPCIVSLSRNETLRCPQTSAHVFFVKIRPGRNNDTVYSRES